MCLWLTFIRNQLNIPSSASFIHSFCFFTSAQSPVLLFHSDLYLSSCFLLLCLQPYLCLASLSPWSTSVSILLFHFHFYLQPFSPFLSPSISPLIFSVNYNSISTHIFYHFLSFSLYLHLYCFYFPFSILLLCVNSNAHYIFISQLHLIWSYQNTFKDTRGNALGNFKFSFVISLTIICTWREHPGRQ